MLQHGTQFIPPGSCLHSTVAIICIPATQATAPWAMLLS